jgi:putative tryptophan/tyrosine transport system substrate-binding protein
MGSKPLARSHTSYLRLIVLLFVGLAAVAVSANADELPTRIFHIGIVGGTPRSSPERVAFEDRLRELGYVEGRNLAIDYVQFDDLDRGVAAVGELARRGVDVLLIGSPDELMKAAVTTARSVPVVFTAVDFDPLAKGYIASLSHPGGNLTGVVFRQSEMMAKRLDLLTQAVPRISRIVLLYDIVGVDQAEAAKRSAAELGIPLEPIKLRGVPYDYEHALAESDGARGEALMVTSSPFGLGGAPACAEAALRHRLPSISPYNFDVGARYLMSYGTDVFDMLRLAADYVDKILKGAKPGDLPIQQPTKFELVINLKTAKALGLTVPQSLLARADEVIE